MQLNSLTKHHANIEVAQNSDGTVTLTSVGDWTEDSIHSDIRPLDNIVAELHNTNVLWDISAVSEVDSAGVMLFINYHDQLLTNNCAVSLIGITDKHKRLNTILRRHNVSKTTEKNTPQPQYFTSLFQSVGKATVSFITEIILFLSFLGESTLVFLRSLIHPSSIRYGAIVNNIGKAGVQALPIIALTSFLIGVVITYQGAVQLEKFGANIFIVEMISISVTRELAPLITAIVVAGRTGSSYTAQLGVMKITEEIDAMRTMGFDPHHFLVIPRVLALMIALPLLVFFADIIGIAAGMLISKLHLQLSFSEFIHRLQNVLEVKHVWIGLIKAPFFAALIATVSCFRGFQVELNTESIGRYTTTSVVNSIFLVIACDAIFSVVLTELGI
jgi:phospholipid/cholesterol/gamma-HCH transport system permease protein